MLNLVWLGDKIDTVGMNAIVHDLLCTTDKSRTHMLGFRHCAWGSVELKITWKGRIKHSRCYKTDKHSNNMLIRSSLLCVLVRAWRKLERAEHFIKN
jgi:hypothetical protein